MKVPTKLKAFLISFIAVFLMVLLPKIGLKMPKLSQLFCPLFGNKICSASLVTPLPIKPLAIEIIRPSLQKNVKIFKLQKKLNFIPQAMAGSDYQEANAYGVIDFDSGEVLAEKNLSQKTPIASITKIMTAVVALDLLSPSDLLTVTQDATVITPTRFAFNPGDKLTVEELLNGILLTSANDCAEILKDGVDEKFGEGTFIQAMNEKSRMLGLKNSHFENPQGFDGNAHYSSIEDVSLLTRFAIRHYPLISEIVRKDYEFSPTNEFHSEFYMNNWNGLIGVYPGAFGVKIGNTGDAGYTTVVVSTRGDKTILTVVLGAPGVLERDMWASQLLDLGFSQFGIEPANISEFAFREKYQTFKYFN